MGSDFCDFKLAFFGCSRLIADNEEFEFWSSLGLPVDDCHDRSLTEQRSIGSSNVLSPSGTC